MFVKEKDNAHKCTIMRKADYENEVVSKSHLRPKYLLFDWSNRGRKKHKHPKIPWI